MDYPPYQLDDKLIAAVARDGVARARVYPYPDVAVVLGRGSKPEVELFEDAIHADGVPILRRRGGGCAVVLDPGNAIASVVLRLPGLGGSKAAFANISRWIGAGLARLGIHGVVQRGHSDLAVGDRKVGGACIHRSRDLLYYSTTLLVQPDMERMARYLQHPPREPAYRAGRGHAAFVTSLAELAPDLDSAALDNTALDSAAFAGQLASELRAVPLLGAEDIQVDFA